MKMSRRKQSNPKPLLKSKSAFVLTKFVWLEVEIEILYPPIPDFLGNKNAIMMLIFVLKKYTDLCLVYFFLHKKFIDN